MHMHARTHKHACISTSWTKAILRNQICWPSFSVWFKNFGNILAYRYVITGDYEHTLSVNNKAGKLLILSYEQAAVIV